MSGVFGEPDFRERRCVMKVKTFWLWVIGIIALAAVVFIQAPKYQEGYDAGYERGHYEASMEAQNEQSRRVSDTLRAIDLCNNKGDWFLTNRILESRPIKPTTKKEAR